MQKCCFSAINAESILRLILQLTIYDFECVPLCQLWRDQTKFIQDGCDPRVYWVLEDKQRSPKISLDPKQQPLCDDLLPPGW